MKRILVLAYLRNNVGDDLFINQLANRYPDTQFYVRVINKQYIEPFKHNLNIVEVNVKEETFEHIDMGQYDACIYMGGSIFMEGGKVYNLDEDCVQFIKDCKKNSKPFYYISCNYGPYQTEKYFELSKQAFINCTDICFRDLYSYQLFKDIKTVRYAPDLVFSYPIEKSIIEEGTIGISLIDLEIRDDIKVKEQEYISFLSKNIKRYIAQGKKIYLFSFCQYEGDENMVDKLRCVLTREFEEQNIQVVQYNKNIESFLQKYSKMEYMICQRFHSIILSYICKQKFYVISYSKKINNILEDLKIANSYMEFQEIKEDKILDLKDFNEVDETKLNKIRKDAEEQFEAVDRYLKG